MQSPRTNVPETFPHGSSNLLLSLATAPLLAGLWGARTLSAIARDLGETSEELFRGDRLPVLNLPADLPEGEPAESD